MFQRRAGRHRSGRAGEHYQLHGRCTKSTSLFHREQDDLAVGTDSNDASYAQNPTSYLSCTFGSAHTDGLNMSLCDGSAQFVGSKINPEVHRRLGSRHDGQVIDAKKF